ncbi:MAG: helix-turn-helix domain-containing protein [Dehalococcoidia bacterium]|nr:helix-turn-helix domain-containing protein [Dehalococcoidia bacterium]
MDEWPVLLRDARCGIRMPRRVLAEAAGVSVQTVKSYELGLRRPSRALLVAILDALEVDRRLRNEILIGAGFAPDGDHLGPRNADYMFTLAETEALINALPWPAHVNSELMEVLAANSIVQRLWGIDLQHEFTSPIERNLMNFATDPRFADRVKNWESATAVAIGALKGHHRGPVPMPESATAYLSAVLESIYDGDPGYVRRLLDLWDRVPPRIPKVRWFYPVIWDHPVMGEMHFQVSVAVADEPGGLQFHDWIPVDAKTWISLNELMGPPSLPGQATG